MVGGCWVREIADQIRLLMSAVAPVHGAIVDTGRRMEPWPGVTACTTRVPENDHSGYKGVGQKCDDDEVADLCVGHHRERTERVGTFYGMPIEVERVLRATAIERARGKVGRWRKPAIAF